MVSRVGLEPTTQGLKGQQSIEYPLTRAAASRAGLRAVRARETPLRRCTGDVKET